MGGASVLFHAALDERVAFAVVSGAACTYKERMTYGVGIECAQVIPGLLELGDLDDIAGLVAPRPLLLCSAEDDEYSRDASRIAQRPHLLTRTQERRKPCGMIARMVGTPSPRSASTPSSIG